MSTTGEQVGLWLPAGFARKPDAISSTLGSNIAAMETCRAIINHPSYGRSHLLAPDDKVKLIRDEVEQLAATTGVRADVPVSPAVNLPRLLQTEAFLALHNGGSPSISSLAYARARMSGRVIPITFAEYGFSYQPFLTESCLPLLFLPSYPCDSMICTTEVARQATNRILDRLKEEFLCTYGKPSRAQFQLNVIPHGVATDIFKPRDKAETRQMLELPADRKIIMYAGRLDPRSKSDIVPLLMAFQKVVAAQGNKALLLLVGPIEESYKSFLNSAVEEFGLQKSLLYRGDIPQASIPLYYASADVFVSLSDTLQENFGLTVVEAMSAGLPVVVSDWAGYQESVVHEQTGFKARSTWIECDQDLCLLAPFQDWSADHYSVAQSIAFDVDEIAGYLNALVSNESLRNMMGENARQHVLTNYSWERSVGMMWELWRELDQIAAATPFDAQFPHSFLEPHYFHDFADFATSKLCETTRITLTERGQRVSANKERMLLKSDSRETLKPEMIMKMLRFLRLSKAVRFPVRLEDLEHFFGRRHGLPNVIVRRHIMWLLKYNLAEAHEEAKD